MNQWPTWKTEVIFVYMVLILGMALTNSFGLANTVCSVAVLMSFCHAQISDRMAEKQAHLVKPDVECYRYSLFYFVAKESLWLAFFIITHSYPALFGVGIFLLYPVWRKVYRKYVKQDNQAD